MTWRCMPLIALAISVALGMTAAGRVHAAEGWDVDFGGLDETQREMLSCLLTTPPREGPAECGFIYTERCETDSDPRACMVAAYEGWRQISHMFAAQARPDAARILKQAGLTDTQVWMRSISPEDTTDWFRNLDPRCRAAEADLDVLHQCNFNAANHAETWTGLYQSMNGRGY